MNIIENWPRELKIGVAVVAAGGAVGLVLFGVNKFIHRNSVPLDERVKGMLIGTGIGDAKGIPYENMKFEEILKLGPQIEIYAKCTNHLMQDHPKGLWTDDTQLTLALCRALVEKSGFNMDAIAFQHVKAYEETVAGWGGSTRESVKRILDKTHTWQNSGSETAEGDGVVMKMAPLAFYYSTLPEGTYPDHKKVAEIEALTRMTHANDFCVVCSLIHCALLEKIFRMEKSDELDSVEARAQYLKSAVELAQLYEQKLSQKEKEDRGDDLPSIRFKRLLESFEKQELSDEKLIEIAKGGTHKVVNCITMVHGIIAQNPPSFASVFKAAFIGGDTDTNASMVGGIVGCLKGLNAFPKVYVEKLLKREEILKVAEQFVEFLKSK